jgi:predicted transcriptional regulator
MSTTPDPTERELAILKVLWERGEMTVRGVYEVLRQDLPIVQNTVQAFLRGMEEKGLVQHRTEGRTFVYSAVPRRDQTARRLVSDVLQRVFDGAIDQLVESALAVRPPSPDELERLRRLLRTAEGALPKEAPRQRQRRRRG